MSWLQHLADELTARGITGRQRRRIVLELRDHIDCEPGCEDRLGDPDQLAAGFADELATDEARRSALAVFGSLAVAAVALVVSQLTIVRYPGFDHGLSPLLFVPGALGMLVAPQVALVAGTLAAVRALRRRRTTVLPAAEIALIRRRAWVGLAAGLATMAGLGLYVVDFSSVMPVWWLALTGGLAGVAAVALLAASFRLVQAGSIAAGTSGCAGDVFDDLPVIGWAWLRRHRWRLGAVGSVGVAIVMTLVGWHAEHSLIEGLERGVLEGLVAAVGFALLGRAVGLGSDIGRLAPSTLAPAVALTQPTAGTPTAAILSDRLPADEDRAHAELVLRDGFSHGRLSLEEFSTRIAAVHAARTVGQLRDALSGLPDDA